MVKYWGLTWSDSIWLHLMHQRLCFHRSMHQAGPSTRLHYDMVTNSILGHVFQEYEELTNKIHELQLREQELYEMQQQNITREASPPPPYSPSPDFTAGENPTPMSTTPSLTPSNSSGNLQQYVKQVSIQAENI